MLNKTQEVHMLLLLVLLLLKVNMLLLLLEVPMLLILLSVPAAAFVVKFSLNSGFLVLHRWSSSSQGTLPW